MMWSKSKSNKGFQFFGLWEWELPNIEKWDQF